ncbi:MAG: PSD1 and planctomycete cytochrome C domain-containing protein [Pirellulales bacterium]|nr:PSD1 and planctomycete cytochrome C domain-containing protein [Pirellulales bacterium]
MSGKPLIVSVLALLFGGGVGELSAQQITPEELKFFETKIRPVLIKECYGCHSNKAGNVRGGLRLDTKQLTHIGGSSGPAVVPGDLQESLLYNAITHQDFVMPPKRKLSDEVIGDFRKWIEMGAPDPRETKLAEIKSTVSEQDIAQAKANFWAYQKPVKIQPSAVEDEGWVKTEIDRYILGKLEQSGLEPSRDARAHQVLRRLCFDLIGLPPTPQQIEYFSRMWKESPDQAITTVVDRLLEQDQFGERWGRHWLDVARYAESTGREVNMTYPHAWRYRDYVIDSFNQDKPFDRFVQEQLAGDLLPVETDEQWTQNLVATGFLAMGPKNVNEANGVQFVADLVDEQIDTTTRVFLGTSVACARCHDHKFDAISQTDYYAMAGIFGSTETYFGNPPSEMGSFSSVQARRNSSLLLLPVPDPNPFDKRYSAPELAQLREDFNDKLAEAAELRRSRLRRSQGDSANAPTAQQQRLRLNNQLAELSAKLAVVDADGNPRSYCMGVQDRQSPRDARLLVRGEIDQLGPTIARGFPRVLSDHTPSLGARASGRLELARWIGSDDNPLTARVMVNRIWQQLIGQGLVTSTENFGVTGQPPSHPELLDYLAVRFVESGWSVKAVIREIATSRVYRMDSAYDERKFEYDPDNALVWRANSRRLDAEAIRDAMLSISGSLDRKRPRGSEVARAGYTRVRDGVLGDPRELARRYASEMARRSGQGTLSRPAGRAGRFGPRPVNGQRRGRFGSGGFQAYQQIAERVQNQLDMVDADFRSVYLPIVRDEIPRSLEVFDFADANTVTGVRESSNTANQALYMMNNSFVIEQSDTLAKRLAQQHDQVSDQISAAFALIYGRPPSRGERSATTAFLRSFPAASHESASGVGTLSALCQNLFASAEFRYID